MSSGGVAGSRDSSPCPNRLKNFKNTGKDLEEMRRRRQETSVELRKAKKDDQLLKRRNITIDDNSLNTSAEQALNMVPNMSLEEIINTIGSADPNAQLQATQATRKMLSRERNPPINSIISAGIVHPLVGFLGRNDR